ncbi:MAG TPA: hypothetical protein VHN15_03540 [Thermoanaerobaculia bacterium]|nr:hypothetical protein [Thermoanaerobaculia bacterium]
MSMKLFLIKVTPGLSRRIVDSKGRLLNELMSRTASDEVFRRDGDVFDALDYRDISFQAEDPEDPVYPLFQGDPLLAGYEWTYGPPAYFDPPATAELHTRLQDGGEIWPIDEMCEFLGRAVEEGKGLIVGVA